MYDPHDAANGDEGVVLDDNAESESGSDCAVAPSTTAVAGSAGRRISQQAAHHQGPSTLWDDDQEWILIFDRLLNGDGRRGRDPAADPRFSGAVRDPQDGINHQSVAGAPRSTITPSTRSAASRKASDCSSASGANTTTAVAGAVDEAMFMAAFEQVPRPLVSSVRDLEDTMLSIREVLGKSSNAWDDRVDALRKLRGVVMVDGARFDELHQHLRLMEPALQLTLQDLRSQVVREVCITVAYLAQQLNHRADHVCLALLPFLIDLIPNSAKVISSAGIVAIRFIIQHAPSARLLPVITGQAGAKSRDIRRACAEFLEQLVTSWPAGTQQRHVSSLQETLRRGVSDADAEVRATCRRTYWGFAAHFPQQAEALLNSLDSQHRRSLTGETIRQDTTTKPAPTAVRSHSALGETPSGVWRRAGSSGGLLQRTGSLSRRPAAQPRADPAASPSPAAPRSSSAIDLQAVQRAGWRGQYAASDRQRASSAAAAASLPGSRSVSPSSRLGYVTLGPSPLDTPLRPTHRRSGIPRSTGNSREASPHRRAPGSSRTSPVRRGGKAASRILQQSQAAETALADALRAGRLLEAGSDESETSSVGSERSLGSGRQRSRLPVSRRSSIRRQPVPGAGELSETLALVASSQWSHRKEGLLQLRATLGSSRSLTATELRSITDTLSRLFTDQHTKVFGVFLETVQELLLQYASELSDWLYVMLARLLQKLGADLLGSVVHKIEQTLQMVRSSFPCEAQLRCVCRLVTGPGQTPSVRAKTATLQYLQALLETMESTQLTADPQLTSATAKILQWAGDQRSAETRSAARAVLVSMFYLNTAQFTKLQLQLTLEQQELASDIIHNHLHRLKDGQHDRPAVSSAGSPYVGDGAPPRSARPQHIDRLVGRSAGSDELAVLPLDTACTPDSSDRGHGWADLPPESPGSPPVEEGALVTEVLSQLRAHDLRAPETTAALRSVGQLANSGSHQLWTAHAGSVVPLLLDHLSDGGVVVQELALSALTELVRRPATAALLSPSVDAVWTGVLRAHHERSPAEREVARAAELCAAALATRLPMESAVASLAPPAGASSFPENQAAVKALTRLAEVHTAEDLSPHLSHIMPALLRAYDSRESSVRKAAVFCMVTLHALCGEQQLQPHLVSLPAAKLKLLNVYIRRTPSSVGRAAIAPPK